MKWIIKQADPIEKWFAWLPVKINNEIIWLECVYRYYIEGGCGDGVYMYAKTHKDMIELLKGWKIK